ncbi:hypothetical protein D9M71_325240 [compost metagenome]
MSGTERSGSKMSADEEDFQAFRSLPFFDRHAPLWSAAGASVINSLNSYHPIYRIAKAYGLIVETGKPVVFHFETVGSLDPAQR